MWPPNTCDFNGTLTFSCCGNKSHRSCAVLDQGAQQCGRVLHHFLYCVNNVRCMWGREGPACIHHRLGGIRGEDRTGCRAGRQTPPLSFLSFLHRLRQRLWRIYIISVRHSVQSVCLAALNSAKFDPSKHSSRHMLLFLPSERLMGLIHNFNHTEL